MTGQPRWKVLAAVGDEPVPLTLKIGEGPSASEPVSVCAVAAVWIRLAVAEGAAGGAGLGRMFWSYPR